MAQLTKVYGIDFTSAPTRKKPITCIQCTLTGNALRADHIRTFYDFYQFEGFLNEPGPWAAAIDFPFGQPRKLVRNLAWPSDWPGYIRLVSSLSKSEFVSLLTSYCESRPYGDRHHLRLVDGVAHSCSPMMLYGVPVGKMFHMGAPLLLAASASILPCRPTNDNRVVLEGYPKLVVQKCVGNRPYKSDDKKKQTINLEKTRVDILSKLTSNVIQTSYGLTVELTGNLSSEMAADPTGDRLDAFLCALQAAWAVTNPNNSFGIPTTCYEDEGWIVDPELLGHQ